MSQIENMFYNIFSFSSGKIEHMQSNKKSGWHTSKLRLTNPYSTFLIYCLHEYYPVMLDYGFNMIAILNRFYDFFKIV